MDNKIDVNSICKEILKQEENSIQLLSVEMDSIIINTDSVVKDNNNNNDYLSNNDDTVTDIININKSLNNVSNNLNVQDKSSVCYRYTYLKRKLCQTGFYSILRNHKY